MADDAKTKPGTARAGPCLDGLEPDRRAAAARLIAILSDVTAFAPVIWRGSMVEFGRHDTRDESGHAGSRMTTGFVVRKAALSVCILAGHADFGPILAGVGKHRPGKACL